MDRQLSFFGDQGYFLKGMTESENKGRASKHKEVAADNEQTRNLKEPSLLDQILSPTNLEKAIKHVVAKGGAPGIDGMNVRTELENFLKENLGKITQKIRQRKYKPKPVKRVLIP